MKPAERLRRVITNASAGPPSGWEGRSLYEPDQQFGSIVAQPILRELPLGMRESEFQKRHG